MAKPVVDDLDKHVAQRLKRLRQQQGISAQALAEAIGSTQQQVSRYENGHNKISATQLYRIANAMAMPMSWFFYDNECANPEHRIAEEPASYQQAMVRDELAILSELWPQMTLERRQAVLKIIELLGAVS